MNLDHCLRDPDAREEFVSEMFDTIAVRYDRFTRWFSFGMDQHWKRMLQAAMAAAPGRTRVVLDLACGTGDLTVAAATAAPGALVCGIDRSAEMLRIARHRRVGLSRIVYCRGDLTHISAASDTIDLVTVGYGLRNTSDFRRGLDEIARVLRPGGWLLTLDFYRPANPIWRWLFVRYLWAAGSAYGWLWHRQPQAYGYIAKSIRYFVSADTFQDELERRRFDVEQLYSTLFGGIGIHLARLRVPRA